MRGGTYPLVEQLVGRIRARHTQLPRRVYKWHRQEGVPTLATFCIELEATGASLVPVRVGPGTPGEGIGRQHPLKPGTPPIHPLVQRLFDELTALGWGLRAAGLRAGYSGELLSKWRRRPGVRLQCSPRLYDVGTMFGMAGFELMIQEHGCDVGGCGCFSEDEDAGA